MWASSSFFGSLQFRDSLLGDLQLTFNLPSLLLNVTSASFLLVQRALEFIQVGNLIIERPDCVVPVGLLLFQLLDGNVQIFNVLLNSSALLFKSLLVRGGLDSLLFCSCQLILGILQLDLKVSLLGRSLGLSLVVLR